MTVKPDARLWAAGPGTGKTTACRQHCQELVNAGKRVLALSFTRAAARNLTMSGVEARTVDAFYYHRLKEFGMLNKFFEWGDLGLLKRLFVCALELPEFRSAVSRYDVVVLDEAQDCDEVMFDTLLTVSGGRLHVFGDIDQSIYEWRGSDPGLLLRFAEGAEVTKLCVTYRLTRQVLEASQRLISHNSGRIHVPLRSLKEGPEVVFERTRFGREAALKLAESYGFKDVAVLTRNVEGRSWIERFWAAGFDRVPRSHVSYAGTIHGTKGLEWEHVIVVDADWQEFRWERTERARRLFYVAMTRTCSTLHIFAMDPVPFVKEALGREV